MKNLDQGTKTNCLIAFLSSILALGVASLFFLLGGMYPLVLSIMLWGFAVFNFVKGNHAPDRTLFIPNLVILGAGGLSIIAVSIFTMLDAFKTVFG